MAVIDTQILAYIQDILVGGFVIFALLLTLIGFLAYNRTKIKKLLYISLGFAMFLVKGIILSLAFFTDILWGFQIPEDFMLAFDVLLIIDFLILVILYFATFKK